MRRKRLTRSFFVRPTLLVAKELLGKYLVRGALAGKIVEVEAYIGPKDKASHAYGGKMTARNKTEYLEGGHIYIYLCYGMHWQFNVVTAKKGQPECVLIRALEPIRTPGVDFRRSDLLGRSDLANGPGKLCRWLGLNKSFDGEDLTKSKRIWLEDRGEEIKNSQIAATARIGIDYAQEWAKRPWRFYIKK